MEQVKLKNRSKKRNYEQRFKIGYKVEFRRIAKSVVGATLAFCNPCRCGVSIAHGGRDDLRKHSITQMHVTAESAANIQPKIAAFVSTDRSVDVTRAELLFTSFLIEHNVALSAADHAGLVFRMMFPDSELAKNYGSA
jgi:hypothetical protein